MKENLDIKAYNLDHFTLVNYSTLEVYCHSILFFFVLLQLYFLIIFLEVLISISIFFIPLSLSLFEVL